MEVYPANIKYEKATSEQLFLKLRNLLMLQGIFRIPIIKEFKERSYAAICRRIKERMM